MTSFEIFVNFTNKIFSFRIELDTLSIDYIKRLIFDHFCINMDEFLLEILDQCSNKYIILDEFCINKLRSNVYCETTNILETRIRSKKEDFADNQPDTDTLESKLSEESKILFCFLYQL